MQRVFIGSEVVAAGVVTKYQLRAHFRRIFPDMYARAGPLSVQDRAVAAFLWSRHLRGLAVTTLPRTAFDLARRGTVGQAVARLDALANATRLTVGDVLDLLPRHPKLGGVRRIPDVLELVDDGTQSPKRPGCDCCSSTPAFRARAPRYRCPAQMAARATTSTWAGRMSWSPPSTTVNTTASAATPTPMTSSDPNTSTTWAGGRSGWSQGIDDPRSSNEQGAHGY
jgi:hypothetical protein